MKAIRIYEHGGPEVLRFEEMPRPIPRALAVNVGSAVNPKVVMVPACCNLVAQPLG